MADILAKKNRHLFLEEKDNQNNSFIRNINYAVENIDTIKTFNDNVNSGTMQHLLETYIEQVGTEGNAWVVKLTELGENILATTSGFNYAAVLTATQDIEAGATITLPEAMKYRVGTHMLLVSWNGTVCYNGDQYEEIGAFNEISTTIKIKQPIKIGDKLEFRTVALADTTSVTLALGDAIDNYPIITNSTNTERVIAERFSDIINVKDFGAKGDGTTDDSGSFEALEECCTGQYVDLLGNTYVVDAVPSKNYYYNGFFKVSGHATPANCPIFVHNNPAGITGRGIDTTDNTYFLCGPQFSEENLAYAKYPNVRITDAFSWGAGNFQKNIENEASFSGMAIGYGIMSENVVTGSKNIGIGEFALHNASSGGRNIAIGSLALFANTTGYQNIAIGRDAGQCISAGHDNVYIGYRCSGGNAPICLDGSIHSVFDSGSVYNSVFIGNQAMDMLTATSEAYNNVTIGARAGETLKNCNRSVLIGTNVARQSQREVSHNRKNLVKVSGDDSIAVYTASGNSVTVTKSGHSAVVDCYVCIFFISGVCHDTSSNEQLLYVTDTTSDTFTLEIPVELYGSGNCSISEYEQSTSNTDKFERNVCIGSGSVAYAKKLYNSVIVGENIGSNADLDQVSYSVCIGQGADVNVKKVQENVCIGWAAGPSGDADIHNVSIGYHACACIAGDDVTDGQDCHYNTAVGVQALSALQGGGTTETLVNSTGIGYNARVSGSNQVQLGNADTTVYAYGSVQNRSDERDKADIRDTHLGLDFLLSLRPVDFKWDYREDYIETVDHKIETVNEEGETVLEIETEVVRHEKDGSRKRNRYHHGLIAQEVKAVLDSKDIDFGGYQDHKINGGEDVLSLGYEEFIAPMIKAIQELNNQLQTSNAKIEALMQRISALENNH